MILTGAQQALFGFIENAQNYVSKTLQTCFSDSFGKLYQEPLTKCIRTMRHLLRLEHLRDEHVDEQFNDISIKDVLSQHLTKWRSDIIESVLENLSSRNPQGNLASLCIVYC